MTEGVPGRVLSFVRDNVRSLEQLQLLLLLQAEEERWWSAETVAAALDTPVAQAATHLEDLACRNLLDIRTAERLFYRYAPGSVALDRAARETVRLFRQRPGAVIAAVYSPMDEIRGFADAFRIRGASEEDDG
jgi:hypothetical protein